MESKALIEETRLLMNMVDQSATSLADEVLELSTSTYTDPDLFAQERTRFFRDYPQFVGPSSLLPNVGDYFAFDDTGIPLFVIRTQDGGLNAFVNACSHRGAPIVDGRGTQTRLFSCPYHGWTYDLDGQLRGVPYQDPGFCGMDKASKSLKRVAVAEKDGLIFALPNPQLNFDIDEILGGIGATLSGFDFAGHHLFGTKRMDVAMNWKLNMDTFHEFYHFNALHPETIAKMSYNNIAHYYQYGRNHQMSAPTRLIDNYRDKPETEWNTRQCLSLVNYLFPNSVIFVVEDHFQTFRLYPVDQNHSVVYHSMYLPQAPKDEEQQQFYAEYFQMINDVVVNEDYALGQRIQRGLTPGLERTVTIGRNEPGVQNMHRQIADVLAGGGHTTTLKVA